MKFKLQTSFLFCVFYFTLISLFAQSWEKTFPHDEGYGQAFDIIEDSDGNYILAGELDLPTGAIRHYQWILKIDPDGNKIWSKVYGIPIVMNQSARALIQINDKAYLIAGSNLDGKATLNKISTDGDSLWTRSYGESGQNHFNDLINKDNGDIILVGQYDHGINDGIKSAWAICVNTNGDIVWDQKYDSISNENRFLDIQKLDNNQFLLVGTKNGIGLAIQIDGTDGTKVWERNYPNSTYDVLFASVQNKNNLLIGGLVTGFAGESPALFKTDLEGENDSTIFINSISYGAITDVENSDDGGYIMTGSKYQFYQTYYPKSGFITKLKSDFSLDWEIVFDEDKNVNGAAIMQTQDGSYVMAGSDDSGIFVKKIASIIDPIKLVNSSPTKVILSPNPSQDYIRIQLEEDSLPSFSMKIETVRIFDSTGRLLGYRAYNEMLDVSDLSSGIYYIQVNELYVGKMVKE